MKSYKKLLYSLLLASCVHASIFAKKGWTTITLNLPAGEVVSNFQGEHRYEFWSVTPEKLKDFEPGDMLSLISPDAGTTNQFTINPKPNKSAAYAIYKDGKQINKPYTANRFYGKAKWNWTINSNDGETIVGS